MLKSEIPPKPPPPKIEIYNHHSVNFSWKAVFDRLPIILYEEYAKCLVELSLKKHTTFDEPWITKYTGFAEEHEVEDLDQDTEYSIRIRLRNKRGWGEYSDETKCHTPKEPISGDDLHRAIIMDDEAALLKILDSGKSTVNVPDRFDYTPLMACTIRNLERLLKCLLEFGVDVNIQNKSGKTALMLAANKAHIRIVQNLISYGSDVKLKDRMGMSALFYAIDAESLPVVRMLVEAGCDVNEQDRECSWTPLIRLAVLANNGNPKIGAYLIQQGAKISHQDSLGNCALTHCAFHVGHAELADVLLKAGADLHQKNKSGSDAYRIAKSLNNRTVLNVMEEYA